MNAALKLAVAALLTLLLSGCMLAGSADLGGVAQLASPVTAGDYVASSSTKDLLQIALDADGRYQITGSNGGPPSPVSIFGPVGGYYVAQFDVSPSSSDGPKLYAYVIIRVAQDGSIFYVDEPKEALGSMLFDGLKIPTPANADVEVLTDNAALNWALLQRLIITGAATFKDVPYAAPTR